VSEFHSCTISLTDDQCIIEALIEMGYQPKVNDKPQNLYGYLGDKREQKAHIIIPRSQITNASNDIGFEKIGKDYTVHISQYDEQIHSFDLDKLKQLYGKHRVQKFVKMKTGKYNIKSQKVKKDGTIEIVIRTL
jgi:hypothetical protein